MSVTAIVGLCIVATVFCKLIEKFNREYAMLISLLTSAFILVIAISSAEPAIELAKSLIKSAKVSDEFIKVLFKALGICYVTQLGCDICKDSGETALSTQIELVGKIAMLVTALPLFNALTEIIRKILS